MKSIQSRLLIMLLVFIILPYFLSMLLIYRQTKENVELHELENSREQIGQASEDLEQYSMTSLIFRIFYTEILTCS